MMNTIMPQGHDSKESLKKSTGPLLVLLLVFIFGLFVGRFFLPSFSLPVEMKYVGVQEGERQLIFPTFWEAWDTLHNKFDGELTDEDLFYGAVAGLVNSAGDPYTVFSDPDETRQFEETIGGSFSGIGIEIGVRNNIPTVIAPLEGSPAQQAGLEPGDLIVGIDGQALSQNHTLNDVVQKIRGPRGTQVTLSIIHPEADEALEISITRDTIEIESVKSEVIDGIAHVTISSFNADTDTRFNTVARELAQQKVRGIILDVRNNPGGFLDGAVRISSRFIPKGQLVVLEKGNENKEYYAEGNTLLSDVPVVVLVNNGSASASEILAGALHDNLHAPIIGTRTFGKGSVQELVNLRDGSSIRVTVAKWFTPEGRNIDKDGIEPDIAIEQNRETDADEQLDAARVELLKLINA